LVERRQEVTTMKASTALVISVFLVILPGAVARLGETLDEPDRSLFVDQSDVEFMKLGKAQEITDTRIRKLVINKDSWPECLNMTAIACKEKVDYDIMTLNTEVHHTIRSVIIDKRTEQQRWYNAVAIPIWSNGWVSGRYGDGVVYYDFFWNSAGVEVDDDEERNIPLTEIDPESHLPVQVSGSTLRDHLHGIDNRPIAGGHYDPTVRSTEFGKRKLERELGTDREVAERGRRRLGPWDCAGMSGIDCCLMIKHEIRDVDENHHGIQCYLDYKTGTRKYYEQQYNGRVRIFADENGYVTKVPVIG